MLGTPSKGKAWNSGIYGNLLATPSTRYGSPARMSTPTRTHSTPTSVRTATPVRSYAAGIASPSSPAAHVPAGWAAIPPPRHMLPGSPIRAGVAAYPYAVAPPSHLRPISPSPMSPAYPVNAPTWLWPTSPASGVVGAYAQPHGAFYAGGGGRFERDDGDPFGRRGLASCERGMFAWDPDNRT
jgi:hypothetical protein